RPPRHSSRPPTPHGGRHPPTDHAHTRRRDDRHGRRPRGYGRTAALSRGPASDEVVMKRIATIGVYGFTVATFVQKLADASVQILLDLRQRRGVRGAEYSWANSTRLQNMLATAHIDYRHVPALAPTTELRQLQRSEERRV